VSIIEPSYTIATQQLTPLSDTMSRESWLWHCASPASSNATTTITTDDRMK